MEHPMLLGAGAAYELHCLQKELRQAQDRLGLALAGQDRDEMVERHLCVLDAEMALGSFHRRRKMAYNGWVKVTIRWVEDR